MLDYLPIGRDEVKAYPKVVVNHIRDWGLSWPEREYSRKKKMIKTTTESVFQPHLQGDLLWLISCGNPDCGRRKVYSFVMRTPTAGRVDWFLSLPVRFSTSTILLTNTKKCIQGAQWVKKEERSSRSSYGWDEYRLTSELKKSPLEGCKILSKLYKAGHADKSSWDSP